MIMFHPDTENIGDGKRYWKGWIGKYKPTAGELADIITKNAVSPCMWNGGIRNKDNFVCADWFGLDFDEGVTLAQAQEIFEPYLHVIATTKSHQVEKGGKKCDRFRVFLRFGVRCRGKDQYEETAKEIINKFGADQACKDAARFFWPCKEIISIKRGGMILLPADMEKVAAEKEAKEERLRQRKAVLNLGYAPSKAIPSRVRSLLALGAPEGTRNKTCFSVACTLGEVGFDELEALELIWNSAIPIDQSNTVYQEVKNAVRNAYKKIGKG